ncbi:MAG TPA: nucleotidyl transferase AbiEii/AbiGii toxin family protein [Burkholderiales bacterium]|nr:nucleotidyl transferase AbiEii/AbiGii toxin family protein [Burkholderiales bacterium]
MALSETYRRQVGLVLRVMPAVVAEECFALKGGTAINLFVHDLPRLSVDIDLTYLPVEDRASSLRGIEKALERIAERAKAAVPRLLIERGRTREERSTTALFLRSGAAQVKVEVTPVLRGCVFVPELREVTPSVEEQFGYAEMRVVSLPDLYAGKIVAALDRQHPRDLFDVRELLARQGVTDELRRAFLVYLISHDRRMSEILAPARKDLTTEFAQGFEGMTTAPVPLEQLEATREALIEAMVGQMPRLHRRFLIDTKAKGEADWEGLGPADARNLPAVRWKLQNLGRLEAGRRDDLAQRLAEVLGIEV